VSNPAQPEPSMEEILASIRRIISEDPAAPAATAEVAAPPPAAPAPAAPAPAAVDDVMDLTPDMRADVPPPAPTPAYEPPPAPVEEPVFEAAPAPLPEPDLMPEPEPMPPAQPEAPIMSPQTEAIASAALAGLSAQITSATRIEGDTIEGIVRELLRPMLREWMDRNLPTLVERLVESEIERLARRRS